MLKLALMDTGARPETAEQTARRQGPMAMARAGKLIEVADESFVFFVHPNRHGDVALRDTVRAMAEESGGHFCASNRPSWDGRTRGPDSPPFDVRH